MMRSAVPCSVNLAVGLLAWLLSAVPCLAQDRSTSPAQARQPERIAYSSYRPAGWDIYYVERPGATARRLTHHPALDYDAVFSADGAWVVFTSERNGSPDLYALDLKGEGSPRLLVRSDAMEDQASLSADGRWMAFVSTRAGNADVYVLPFRPDATQTMDAARAVTHDPAGDFRPAVSPDGNRIAFSSDRDSPSMRHPVFSFAIRKQGDVYVTSRHGGDARRITTAPGWDGSPAWSTDGKTLYFYSQRDKKSPYRIYSVALAGGGPQPVSPPGQPALSPALKADGSIAFVTWTGKRDNRRWSVRSVGAEGAVIDEGDASIDCMSPHFAGKGGAMVCHGGPPIEEASVADFPGPLLVAGSPRIVTLPDRPVALYGERKGFVAPLHPSMDKVLFRGTPFGNPPRRIRTVTIAGTNPTVLLDLDEVEGFPSGNLMNLTYTRDGAWIGFTLGPFAGAPGKEADVWRVRPDGSELTNLTPDSPGNDGLADFSPDGSRFVFRSGRSGNFDIYLAEGVDTHPRNLTHDPASDTFPALSPRGDQIAFCSDRDSAQVPATGKRTFDIYTLDLKSNGSPGTLRRITDNAAQDAHVSYSPDGAWLIYTSGAGGFNDEAPLVQEVLFSPQMYGEIYAYRFSDRTTVRLTHNKWEDGAPLWTTPRTESGSFTPLPDE